MLPRSRRRGGPVVSVDHLVSAGEERSRDRQIECPRRPEVYHKLVFDGILDGQIAWLGPAQDLVNVARRPPENILAIDAIRQQTAISADPEAERVDRRETMAGC